jgi:putative endonuclease
MDARRIFGNKGEALAAEFLIKKNYKVLDKQYRSPFGEIDLVCQYGEEVVFVEVKTRRSKKFGHPEESITKNKIRHIDQTAQYYLQEKHLTDREWRVDVISIEIIDGKTEILHFESIDIIE